MSRTDGRISMRPLRPDDLPDYYDAVRESVADIAPWLSWCHPGYTTAEAEARIREDVAGWEAGTVYAFALVDAADGRFLGSGTLNHVNRLHRFANLAYWVRSGSAGKGVATAATLLLAWFGFVEVGLARVEIVVDVNNRASLRVAEKAGAHREGVLRNRLAHGPLVEHAVMFALVPEDFGLTPLPALCTPARGSG